MNTFINLSPKQSASIHKAIFENARQLKKDAGVIAEINKSYHSATSLLILSSEEVIKAILVLLHSEGYAVYKIENAKKFFKDHKVRHELAQLIEMTSGFIESMMKFESQEPVKLIRTKSAFWNDLLNGLFEVAKASTSFLEATKRVKLLEGFDILKNKGLYVDYQDSISIPKLVVTEHDFMQTNETVERLFKIYKGIRLLFHPSLKNHLQPVEVDNLKNQLKMFIDQGMRNYSFNKIEQ